MPYDNFETNAIRTRTEQSDYREHSSPIYFTSSFTFDDAEQARALFADEVPGNIYTRFSNPNPKNSIPRPPSFTTTLGQRARLMSELRQVAKISSRRPA